ncbi:MAG: Tim44/TimA family putative adaptor protein [Rickettsiales bacterium]|nr:Tim44/TimA family putative adaptor protein [Rickettsiales bacterium]
MEATYGDIIFFALVAAFIAFRLFSVLGKKDSDDQIQEIIRKHEQASAGVTPEASAKKAPAQIILNSKDKKEDPEIIDEVTYSDITKQNLAEISSKDANFKVNNFVYGAKLAFEMVFKAYSTNDRETLKNLLAGNLFETITQKLNSNLTEGKREERNIVSIDAKEITSASLNNNIARVRLKVLSEQINLVKNEAGELISGNPTQIEIVEDEWEFERNIKSLSPNWLIVSLS